MASSVSYPASSASRPFGGAQQQRQPASVHPAALSALRSASLAPVRSLTIGPRRSGRGKHSSRDVTLRCTARTAWPGMP